MAGGWSRQRHFALFERGEDGVYTGFSESRWYISRRRSGALGEATAERRRPEGASRERDGDVDG